MAEGIESDLLEQRQSQVRHPGLGAESRKDGERHHPDGDRSQSLERYAPAGSINPIKMELSRSARLK